MRTFHVIAGSFAALAMLAGCDVGTEPKGGDTTPTVDYRIDTANVDYKDANNVVFFDFSSGEKTVVAHDTWHIAFDTDLNVIANSGNYGSDVAVCSTGTTGFGADFTDWFGDTTKTFTRTDIGDNILGTNWMDLSGGMPPSYTEQVYLLKTKGANNYKVQFTGAGMGGTLTMKIAAPDAATADEQTFSHNSDYEYTYIDCASKQAVLVAPKKDAWDIRFGRTEFAMGTSTGGRSSIAINTAGGVSVAVVEDKDIDEVTEAGPLSYSTDLLAIGNGWYEFDRDTRTFSVEKKTYVVKTTGGNYAKFQPATFDGPNGESFWCVFEYLYQDDGAATFSK